MYRSKHKPLHLSVPSQHFPVFYKLDPVILTSLCSSLSLLLTLEVISSLRSFLEKEKKYILKLKKNSNEVINILFRRVYIHFLK